MSSPLNELPPGHWPTKNEMLHSALGLMAPALPCLMLANGSVVLAGTLGELLDLLVLMREKSPGDHWLVVPEYFHAAQDWRPDTPRSR